MPKSNLVSLRGETKEVSAVIEFCELRYWRMGHAIATSGEFEEGADIAAEVTQLLQAMSSGDSRAQEQLFSILYHQLRGMAERVMANQPVEHTLQPTALVNEAYLRVIRSAGSKFVDRKHFLSVASRAMRHLLVDHARRKGSAKRTGGGTRVGLDSIVYAFEERSENLEALDSVLERFAKTDPTMAQAIDLRFFGGAGVEETADAVGLPIRTFERRWQAARHYLRVQLQAQ